MANKCILIDLERSIKYGYVYYWKARKIGYTTNLDEAGRYDEEEAKKIAEEDLEEKTVVINESVIDNIGI